VGRLRFARFAAASTTPDVTIQIIAPSIDPRHRVAVHGRGEVTAFAV
jgi:hypothetical protein